MTPRVVTLPPDDRVDADGARSGGWWHTIEGDDRIVCDLCPRACHLKPGTRGFCFVRENRAGRMVLATYGRSSGFCVDPIEKKPLNHFFPGTSVLSFGTAGCNLGCQFCQNWSISKSREIEKLAEEATPEMIARAARELGCASVAFTYNDPVIWAEYAIDVARACREVGVKTVAVTAGYITEVARGPFYEAMDAANVDLKAFSEEFYQKITLSHLAPVLETLRWLHAETDVWFEITTLLIPRANDDPDEIRRMCDWMLGAVGDEVPVHFTAFHPDFRMRDRGPTPHETLIMAHDIARRAGLKYVYTGNVHDPERQSTYCPHCGRAVIARDWYVLGRYDLRGDRCAHCGGAVAGRFGDRPGTWGSRRLPVRMARFAPAASPAREVTMTAAAAPTTLALSAAQQSELHHAAAVLVAGAITRRPAPLRDRTLGGVAGQRVYGVFVSLKRRGRLRGCCGVFGEATIGDALERAAGRTATDDVRLPPVSATELRYLDLEVWTLHSQKPILARGEDRRAEVEIGRHGLWVRRGQAGGLLLPGVAVESGVDAAGFLEMVCVKANLPPTAWKEDDVQLGTFEGVVTSGPFDATVAAVSTAPAVLTAAGLERLAEHCRSNIVALRRGAMAGMYLAGGPDGTVHGLSIAVRLPQHPDVLRFSQLSLRPGLPLQSTLFTLAEAANRGCRPIDAAVVAELSLDVTVLSDPAMHGSVAQPDFDGFDPATRALMVLEGVRSAWVYDPTASPDALLARAAREARVRQPASAFVLSLAAASTEPGVTVTDVPRPQAGPAVRPPAVAGSFYPAEPADLGRVVRSLMSGVKPTAEPVPAVMVPHAGLKYSGRIAAAVYERVVIPEVVVVLAPRHYRQGADWAIAPHETWSLPGVSIASDPTLARALAEAIPDLELDAVAHQREHSIEVQLPLLAHLAPHARVVGIALGAGDLDRCRELAAGLADVLRAQRVRPLLVISTDLNHYASDTENRRLDAIALAAVERLDPGDVYRTVTGHRISMCGLLPTVVGMETLRRLDRLGSCERVGYGTSADATGDTSRVVGYAGMLFR